MQNSNLPLASRDARSTTWRRSYNVIDAVRENPATTGLGAFVALAICAILYGVTSSVLVAVGGTAIVTFAAFFLVRMMRR